MRPFPVKFLMFVVTSMMLLASSLHAPASVKTKGLFEAVAECAANKKLRSDNPGEVMVRIGEIYQLIALNSQTPTHYQVIIPNAPVTTNRWVAAECGVIALDDAGMAAKIEVPKPKSQSQKHTKILQPAESVGEIENLLALSWLPTFCLSEDGKRARECKRLRPSDVYATQFSIHGLWPNDLDDKALYPCYCHLDRPLKCNARRKAFSSIDISKDLRNELQTKMPGIQSGFLHRHEWTKHGTCYEKYNTNASKGADAQEYYRDTVLMLDQVNDSIVAELFQKNVGKFLSDDAIYGAFDKAFGQGASDKVFIDCKRHNGERHISELFIGLGGEITPDSDIAPLIKASPSRYDYTNKTSCKSGRVTAVR
ncbi:ribonuclease I [Lentilitoribacter sp. Alg239-R112]|uniref:ribonuclease T2 family protein n=1 Tax=Lentilitoribacter sp. Alg239-R112 TaxID=2305987 RepID=UPI0013A698CC|nr:ribonuclease I [Lentilitoribacter sp. Alg239-R112]